MAQIDKGDQGIKEKWMTIGTEKTPVCLTGMLREN